MLVVFVGLCDAVSSFQLPSLAGILPNFLAANTTVRSSWKEDSDSVWYFAIGSMMNKVSVSLRGLTPLESHPAEILDFELEFLAGGAAVAAQKVNSSFHGVLHKMTRKDMKALDKLEGGYQRIPATVRLYNSTILPHCSVYSYGKYMTRPGNISAYSKPSERYMSLLIQGCEQHNVKKSYIDYLRSIPSTPYRRPSEYKTIPIPPNLPTWTEAKLLSGNGKFLNPAYFALNGKVFEYTARRFYFFNRQKKRMRRFFRKAVAGKHLELVLSRLLYDPRFPPLENMDNCSLEQSAAVEDSFAGGFYNNLKKYVKPVARLERNCLM